MGRHKHGKKKVILRNVELEASKTKAKVVKASATDSVTSQPLKSILKTAEPKPRTAAATTAQVDSKYMLPELFSTLAVSHQIERVKNTQAPPITSDAQLTPKSKKHLNTKISKKLNHQLDKNVYSGLAPVGVNAEQNAPPEPRPKYQPSEKKDPEPKLSDYILPLERYIPAYDLSTPDFSRTLETIDSFENILYVTSNLDGEFIAEII